MIPVVISTNSSVYGGFGDFRGDDRNRTGGACRSWSVDKSPANGALCP